MIPFGDYAVIALRSMAVYLFLLLGIRLFGRKELSQLSVIDLIFVLLISNAVQNAMVGPDSSLQGGLIAAAALFLLNVILKRVTYRFPKVNTLLEGEAVMLIHQGKLNIQNAAKVHMTMDEINEAIREHGVERIEQVDLCVLEVDGNISVLSNGYQQVTQRKRKAKKSLKQNVD